MDVQLVYAKAKQINSESGWHVSVSAQIMIKNLSYHKQVALHDKSGIDYQAAFWGKESSNRELWKLYQIFQSSSLGLQFAVKYEAFAPYWLSWDNNRSRDYMLYMPSAHSGQLPCDIAIGSPVLCWSSEIVAGPSTKTLRGTIALYNLAYAKSVSIRYSINDWQTHQDATAQYDPTQTLHIKDGEFWNFNIPLPANAQKVSLAIRYIVAGNEYWDNNFGYNYNLTSQYSLLRD